MSIPAVLVVGPHKPGVVDGLLGRADIHVTKSSQEKLGFPAEVQERIEVIVVTSVTQKISADFMRGFPRLKLVSTFGVGYDHIDTDWAVANGIDVTNTPDVLTEEVADTALGLLLNTVREFCKAENYLRSGGWRSAPFPLSRSSLRDRSVGIVGLGRIGLAIARRVSAFGIPVSYHSRSPKPEVPYTFFPSVMELASHTDTLILAVPGGQETEKLIGSAVLDKLGPKGILINIARGSAVDEPALISALQEGRIAGAGLDVYSTEPNIPAAFLELDNVVLFPHIGTRSAYTHGAMDQLLVDNVLAYAAGKPLLTPVSGKSQPNAP